MTIDTPYFWVVILAYLWSIPWKGVAIWRAARRQDIGWFIIFLVVNSLAIFEILYIFIFSKRKPSIEKNRYV